MMHPGIQTVFEGERGCGRRDKPGRLYLRSDAISQACGKLPLELSICPCCGAGFKPSRTPQWIENPNVLFDQTVCQFHSTIHQSKCNQCQLVGDLWNGALLLWIGEKFYPTYHDFNREAENMGVSRFIQHIPRQFVLGRTVVLLAHRKGKEIIHLGAPDPYEWRPAIFRAFKPTRIEITVTGDEPDSVIESYLERGLTPILVKPLEAKYQEINNQ